MNDNEKCRLFDQILGYDTSDSEFEAYYRIVQTKVVVSYCWYKKHKNRERINFRIAGVTVILFSITIPAISAYSFIGKDIVVSIMALTIAILSGFNSFFKWEESWQSFNRSELAIQHLIGMWQFQLLEAKIHANASDRLSEARKATKHLLDEVGKIISQETDNYFSKIEWPKKQG
jgi:hypothetical protein